MVLDRNYSHHPGIRMSILFFQSVLLVLFVHYW